MSIKYYSQTWLLLGSSWVVQELMERTKENSQDIISKVEGEVKMTFGLLMS